MLSRLSRWFHRLPNVAGPARIGRRHRQQLRLVNLEQRVTPMAGQLDPTFGVGGLVTTTVPEYYFDQGYSPAVDSQGRVLVAGSTQSGSKYLFAVARITTTGILDTSFGIEGKVTFGFDVSESYGYSVAVDSTDRVLVSGEVYNGSKYDFAVARLTNTGTLDPSFDGDGKATISFGVSSRGFRVAVDSTDRVLVSGMTYDGSNFDFAVARLTINGALDSTFDGDGKQTIDFGGTDDRGFSVAVDSADRVVIGGRTVFGSSSRFAVVRLTDTGALDPSFDTDGKASFAFGNVIAYDANVAIDSADRILVSGFTSANANYDFGVARLTVTGSLDTTFDGDGKVTIAFGLAADVGVGVAVDSLDRVVVSGYTFNGSNNDFAVAIK